MKACCVARKLLCCSLWFLLVAGCVGPDDPAARFPERIDGAPRTEFLTGEKALRAVDKLHGTHIAARDAVVAAYGAEHPPVAMVWMSVAGNGAEAREQLAVMLARMAAPGRSPFTPATRERRAGVELYRTDGLGMRHFLWTRKDRIWWLAALPGREESFLRAFLDFAGAGDAAGRTSGERS